MSVDVRETYLESEVLQADGCRLVGLLYGRALESLTEAQRHLAGGRIEERSRAITRASEILTELALAVDHESGGPMSRNLVEIYDYIQHRLQEANFHQNEPPLVEAQRLLETLIEGWEQSLSIELSPPPIEIETDRAPASLDCVG